jgi:hypothetical protein
MCLEQSSSTSAEPESQLDDPDEAIFFSLTEQPFALIQQLARLIHLPKTTVYQRLTQSLGF